MQRIRGLDGLRGLAAVMVFAYHAWGRSGFPVIQLRIFDGLNFSVSQLFNFGGHGVSLWAVYDRLPAGIHPLLGHNAVRALLGLLLTIIIAWASYQLLEKRFGGLVARLLRRGRPQSGAARTLAG